VSDDEDESFERWRDRVCREAAPDAEMFRALIGRSPVPGALTATGLPGVIVVAANGALERLLQRSDLEGADVSILRDPTDLPPDFEVIKRIRAKQVDVLFRRRRYLRGDGTPVTMNTSSVVADHRDGYALHVAAFVEPGRTEWIAGRMRRDDELNAALAELRAALLRGDPTDAVFGLICDCTFDLLGAESSGLLELDGSDLIRVRAADRHRPPEHNLTDRQWRVVDDDFGAAVRSGRTARYRASKELIVRAGGHVSPTVADDTHIHMAVAPVDAAGARFGALVVRRAAIPFSDSDVAVLEAFATGVSDALSLAEARADLERLRVLEVRQQIARNLHDEVTQDLIAVRLGLIPLVPRVADPDLRAELDRSLQDLDDATRRLRDVVAGLDPTTGEEGFVDVLRSITGSKAGRARIEWAVRVLGPVARLQHDERAELLRVVNEAVSNVVRHARATRVDVDLVILDARLVVIVDDDGVGLSGASGRNSGIANLRARADVRRGDCTLQERPEGGTRLQWSIPLVAEAGGSD
jgi:signal transduction histidine kinase